MAGIVRIIDSINKVIGIVVGICLGIMSVVIIYQVISRYFFGSALSWSEELSRYLMVWSIFLGAALALRKQSLIAVEVIAERLPSKARHAMKIVVYVICILFFLLLFVKGLDMMEKVEMQLSPAMQISMAIPYASIPFGAAALTMNSIAVIFELLLQQRNQTEGEAA